MICQLLALSSVFWLIVDSWLSSAKSGLFEISGLYGLTVPVGVSEEIHSRSLVVELEPDAGGEGHEILLQTVVTSPPSAAPHPP